VSARLSVEVSTERLDEARADVTVVAYFDSDRPLRGAAGQVDWRLCGRLSRMLSAEKLRGAGGEAVLLATGPGWAAPRVLGLGLGPRREFDGAAWEALARDAVGRALRMRAQSIAVLVSDSHLGRLAVPVRVAALLRGAIAAYAEDSAPLRLRLVVSEAEADRAREAATDFVSRRSQSPIAVRPETPRELPISRRAPQGGAGVERPGTQIVK
jgi:hypothetical protein